MIDMTANDPTASQIAFLSGGGEMGRLIGRFDWAATAIGPVSNWPQCLKTSVSLMLCSKVPIVMLWGADGIMIYNDAYSEFAAARHPRLLGSKVREGWPEVADFNDNVMHVVLAGGTLAYRDQELTLYRSGKAEQVWMNLDYSPILDEQGYPAGVIAIVIETTAKVAAERWQLSERDRQRQMFEQAPGFMAMMSGPQHIFEVTNAAYRQLVGHRDVLGKPVREALPEITGQGFFELLDSVYATGTPFSGSALKADIQHTPGGPTEERFVDLIYQPVRNPNGEIFGIFAQGSDVTDRILAEQALRRSEAQFRQFAQAMPNHVWTSAPDGTLDWFNQQVYAYAGLEEGSFDGNQWTTIVHPDDLPNAQSRWVHALETKSVYETEFRLRRHDGVYHWHIARAVPIYDPSGALIQWIGTNTDIDDQKKVEQALRQSERRLQLSQNAAGIASLEVDIATGTIMGSERFWQLWGLPQAESVHISVLEQIVCPEHHNVRSTEETRRNGTSAPSVEYRIRRPDTGELRWLSRHVDFVHDGVGRPVKMFGVVKDITDRKESEARHQMLTHELEHRIKNILSMVGAIASQTMRNTDLETARAVFGERLRALANAHDLLNKTRWTNAMMREVIENTVAAFPAGQITISGPPLSINPKMALTLALVVNELGTNALKYGSLSAANGKADISWSLDRSHSGGAGEILTWRWQESGGPPVTPPSRRGFGTMLVERVFGSDFGGTVRIDYAPDGVVCVLTAPAPVADSASRGSN